MAKADMTFRVVWKQSGLDAKQLGELIAEIADMVPEWHEAEKDKLLEQCAALITRNIKLRKGERQVPNISEILAPGSPDPEADSEG